MEAVITTVLCLVNKSAYYLNHICMKEETRAQPGQHQISNFNGYQTYRELATYLPSQGFSTKYDPNNEYLAIGCNNGMKLLYSLKQKNVVANVECPNEQPVTCVKWRPMVNTKSKVLGITNAGGMFDYYHVPTMKKLFSIEQKQNSLHCCDFSKSGEHFATAGKDCHIRIYDQTTKSVSTDLGCAEWNYRGHSNRIFSIKFIDDNTIVSGGWDSVIHLWDIRQGKSVKSVFGPHVAGDSIDYNNGELLIGCYASKNQIQIWDYNKFTVKEGISWTSSEDKDKVAYVYTAGFGNFDRNSIIAGACGINEVKCFHREGGSFRLTTLVHGIGSGCFSIDSSWTGSEFAFTTANQGLFVYKETRK